MKNEFINKLSKAFKGSHRHVDELIMEKSGVIEYPVLFHYTSIEGMKSIISNNNLWATDYRFLNDAQEMMDGLDVLLKELESSEHAALHHFLKLMNVESLVTESFVNPHILSFCSTSDLLSQWRAYGAESEGICLEFDLFTSHLSVDEKSITTNGYLVPVVYDDLIKKDIIVDIIKSIETDLLSINLCSESYNDLSEVDRHYISGMILSKFITPILSFKNKSYAEESEWRAIFLPAKDEVENLRKFRTSNGTFTPYIEAVIIDNSAKSELLPLKSVCLPPGSGKSSQIGLELFLQKFGYKGDVAVNINRSSIPLRSKKAIYW